MYRTIVAAALSLFSLAGCAGQTEAPPPHDDDDAAGAPAISLDKVSPQNVEDGKLGGQHCVPGYSCH